MPTECSTPVSVGKLGGRRVEASFDAGYVTSDGGVLLLGQLASQLRLFERVAACFDDHRSADRTEHSVAELVAQRVLGLACGYEDLNDHQHLRLDQAIAAAVGKRDPAGRDRKRQEDLGVPLASPATLNRLENSPAELFESRPDLKLIHHPERFDDLLLDLFFEQFDEAPEELWLDFDATDLPLHGGQEGRFFHGFYNCYCYLPLYVFCGDHLLVARLRQANQDAAAGTVQELERLVAAMRARWPEVTVVVRADSGFCRDELLTWCEAHNVDFVIGLARNKRLQAMTAKLFDALDPDEGKTRTYGEFQYETLSSWTTERRVVAKAEMLGEKRNARFVVTSFYDDQATADQIYRELYCPRGDAENRIKEQFELFATRVSAQTMRANQLRLWLSGLAYTLLKRLRSAALQGTELEAASPLTIRARLLKLGALVQISVRRVWLRLSTACPAMRLFKRAAEALVRPPQGSRSG